MCIQIQPIRILVSYEVPEHTVFNGSIASIALDHHHLVAIDTIHLVVDNITDVCPRAQAPNGTATEPVAVDLFDEHVVGGVLDGDAFIPVGDFYVVNPHVGTGDVDPIQSAFGATSDEGIVDFSICAGGKEKVELWRVNEEDVVNGEVGYL